MATIYAEESDYSDDESDESIPVISRGKSTEVCSCFEDCLLKPFENSNGEYYCGWWSSTGKEEPSSNGNTRGSYYKAIALQLKDDGKFFFRDDTFSVRGTFYYGKWNICQKKDHCIHLQSNRKNNLKINGGCNAKFLVKNLENGDMEILRGDSKYTISPVCKKSNAKSARN